MQIKTRNEARLSGDNVYFTGEECRNGHISYRYVSSGSCAQCINAPKTYEDVMNQMFNLKNKLTELEAEAMRLKEKPSASEVRALREMEIVKYKQFVEGLVKFNEYVHYDDVEIAQNIVLDAARKRCPNITLSLLFKKPKKVGTGVYVMYAHVDDLMDVKGQIIRLSSRHKVENNSFIKSKQSESFDPKYRELGIKCPPSHLDLLTSLVHYYAMARYGSDIDLDEFVPQAQGASAPDMYWIKCDAEDLPAIKQALES